MRNSKPILLVEDDDIDPELFSVVESPPDRILKRLNNGQPAEVKEAAENFRHGLTQIYAEMLT